MSDEELMRIAFEDKRTVQDILRYIFELGKQQGYEKGYADGSLSVTEEIRSKVIDECIEILKKMKGE